jgi:biopolymer transport protein ExbD
VSHEEHEDGILGGINITPLVDVSLVLLVVMMVAAPMMARASVAMNLPTMHSAKVDPEQSLVIELFEDGRILIDGQLVDGLAALDVRIAEAEPSVRATIRADVSVRHGRVMAVVDRLKRANRSRIAFAAVPATAVPATAAER